VRGGGSGGRTRLEVGEVIQVGDELLVVGAGGRLKVRRKKDKEKEKKGRRGRVPRTALTSPLPRLPMALMIGSHPLVPPSRSTSGVDSSAQAEPPDWPKLLERPEDAGASLTSSVPR